MASHISLSSWDEKRPTRSRSARRNRPWIMIPVALLVLYTVYAIRNTAAIPAADWTLSPPTAADPKKSTAVAATPNEAHTAGALVPLEAHIMSKCPDAKDCLKEMILPAMMRVYEKVNFTLSYIGKTTENDGVECMHGPEECMGNIIELCATHLYPDPKINLGFTMCLTRDYTDIPQRELVEDCALEHGIDFEKLESCAAQDDGAFGLRMLRDSVSRSATAGVTKSCTVRLDEEIYCIRDGGGVDGLPERLRSQ
ncbi:hypothetical protein PG997_008433 [Apiospora hydei]|uniref:Gamma interferon inducible lysosomal thiol reductase n=1 Tax=Apiospora hydei TaxID=1337664 RepID=A0ABR1WDT7_9PEZI